MLRKGNREAACAPSWYFRVLNERLQQEWEKGSEEIKSDKSVVLGSSCVLLFVVLACDSCDNE